MSQKSKQQIIDDAVAQALIAVEKPSKIIEARLAQHNYFIVSPNDIEWEDLQAFIHERNKGMAEKDTAMSFLLRQICALLRIRLPEKDVVVVRKSAQRALDSMFTRNNGM